MNPNRYLPEIELTMKEDTKSYTSYVNGPFEVVISKRANLAPMSLLVEGLDIMKLDHRVETARRSLDAKYRDAFEKAVQLLEEDQ